jgi:methylated-DNA-protein-cysteine methyltransferase related protein
MPASGDFFEQVYAVVRQIPEGKVTSYGAIARFLGSARSSRIVGYAMKASLAMNEVPAHRVVNRNGLLTGRHHFSPPEGMQRALEREGIAVSDHQVQDFESVFWNPEVLLA